MQPTKTVFRPATKTIEIKKKQQKCIKIATLSVNQSSPSDLRAFLRPFPDESESLLPDGDLLRERLESFLRRAFTIGGDFSRFGGDDALRLRDLERSELRPAYFSRLAERLELFRRFRSRSAEVLRLLPRFLSLPTE